MASQIPPTASSRPTARDRATGSRSDERTRPLSPSDAAALKRDLEQRVRGEVRFDDGERALYVSDASNYRQIPIGVVRPRDADDVVTAVEVCRRHGAPITARGTGTSLAGQTCNVAIVLDFTAHMGGFEIDPVKRVARVQPGAILDHVRAAAKEHQLTVGPGPATHWACTLGGMIGNDSCGVHAQMAGRMQHNVHELEILTYEGHRFRVGATSDAEYDRLVAAGDPKGAYLQKLRRLRDQYAERIRERYPDIPRRVSGYSLEALLPENGFHVARALVGSEGTCAIVLEAVVRLVDEPKARTLLVLGYPDVYEAGDHIPEILAAEPIGLEGVDDVLVHNIRKKHQRDEDLKLFPSGDGFLLVEFGGDSKEDSDRKAVALMERLRATRPSPSMRLYDSEDEEKRVWEIREMGLAVTARVPGEPDTWPGWEDSAVPPDKVGAYLRDLRALLERYGYACALYGHFGQGCIHTRIDFDLRSREGIRKYRRFVEEAAELVVSYGGSLSGEHGDGQARGELLVKMFGPELIEAFEDFKRIWDPQWKLNPGKLVRPFRLDENLRYGVDYHPKQPATRFAYPEDRGSFTRAVERCVGVGKCRREDAGTMCPSYKVLREERHTTRGRAHLLFEMLRNGSTIQDGFQSREVEESLDLCLSCKGCKGDCPMKVDVATLKAEFLAQRYQGRLRPRSAYTMGMIWWWSRLASLAPSLTNLAMQTPPFSRIAKWIADVHPNRPLPTYAPETFQAKARRRPRRNRGAEQVLLWVDTWTNHFRPEVGTAAMDVLEAAGFEVIVLQQSLCCGRPLYDFGMLDKAKELLEQVQAATKPYVDRGVPIVVLEPSCYSVFEDEQHSFFPDRAEAERLRESCFTLGQFLKERAPTFRPRLERTVVLHGHCHQKALSGIGPEQQVLERMGCDVQAPDTGCCGMAGTFGYEERKYDVSIAIAEKQLLPHVREARPQTIIVADGFSCRSQIGDLSSRQGLHLAQVLKMALDEGRRGPLGGRPERGYVHDHAVPTVAKASILGGVLALLAGVVLALWPRKRR